MHRRSPQAALVAAVLLAGFAAVIHALAFDVAATAYRDGVALDGFMRFDDTPAEALAQALAPLAGIPMFLTIGIALVLTALRRGRLRLAVAVPVMLLGANITTQVLKRALAEPRVHPVVGDTVDAVSWPSGHSTAAMSLALCAVLVAPPRRRPIVAAVGGLLAVGVGYSLLVQAWHYPSDVLGGFAVAGVWVSLGLAALLAADRRWPAGAGRKAVARARDVARPSALVAAGGAGALLLGGAIAVERADSHTSFFALAAAIGALGLALAAALAAVLRR
jgi:membrane-associated phospholipid phosphatase